MRTTAIVFALMLSMSGAAAAQEEWTEYVSIQDGFKVDFWGQPKVTQITWKSQMEYMLPARVYTADKGREHYVVTVVDYAPIEQLGIERAKTCPPGNAQCRQNAGIMGPGYWKHDERSALVYGTFQLLKRDAKLTSLAYEWQDMVEGHFVQLTNNADQSRTFAWVAMRENKLYILEGTVPKGYPEPGLFYQSLGWVDKDGNGVRYQQIYVNEIYGLGLYPTPGYGRGGQGGPPGAGGAPPGQGGTGAGAPAGGVR